MNILVKRFGVSSRVGVGGKSGGKGCSDRFVGKSGTVGVGGKSGFGGLGFGGQGSLEFGGLGVGGESGVVGRDRVVRFDDDEGNWIMMKRYMPTLTMQQID